MVGSWGLDRWWTDSDQADDRKGYREHASRDIKGNLDRRETATANPVKVKIMERFWENLFAILSAVVVLVVAVVFVFPKPIDKYLKTLVPPNISVTPSDVEVVVPDIRMSDDILQYVSKDLVHLKYFELSQLIDTEFTAFMRMYNHYQQKASPELKAMLIEQAARLDTILAFREEAWITENRTLGSRQSDFTPLKPMIDDLLQTLEQDASEPEVPGSYGGTERPFNINGVSNDQGGYEWTDGRSP